MKAEIKAIRRTQTKGILEMKNIGRRTRTDKSITNTIQAIEEKISAVEDTIEEIHSKKMFKLKNS